MSFELLKNFDRNFYDRIFLFDAQFIGKFCLEHTIYNLDTKEVKHSQGWINGDNTFSRLQIANMKQVHLPLNFTQDKKPLDIFQDLKTFQKDEKILIIFKGKIKMVYLKEKIKEFKLQGKFTFRSFPNLFTHKIKCCENVISSIIGGGYRCSLSNVMDMSEYYNFEILTTNFFEQ